jgi:hypothetical protein
MDAFQSFMKERWADVEGHPGYQVSDRGQVRSVDRVVQKRDGSSARHKGKILALVTNHYGYKTIQTSSRTPLLVHRLVALAFLPVDQDRPQVNHKNGLRGDNRVENLEWVNNSENNLHAFRVLGRRPSQLGFSGDFHARSKPVIATNILTGETRRYGSAREAEGDGFIAQSIAKVCLGQMTQHHGWTWTYAPATYPKASIVRSAPYRRFVASFPCFSCGVSGFSQCAHPNFGKGLGMKTSDLDAFPLCGPRPNHPGCHFLFDNAIDISRDERRELEAKYTSRMQAIARSAGRPEFKQAA